MISEQKYVLYHGSDVRIEDPKCDVGESRRDFGQCYESAMQMVLNSHTYAKLQEEEWLLEEGPLYVYGLLDRELEGLS